jgi:bifunctional enzyme CysN/CysC
VADLLRFATAGSVDDGKSTLIGRLLYDSKSVFQDQLESVERTSADRGDDYTNLALLTDGLRAEREQGITIDVAYRYFSTPVRSFIVADTPGHVQYTRNMVTGASTADLALVLVDARKGVVEQTRRHAALSGLLGVPHVVLAVNKMDLVGYDAAVFDGIVADFAGLAAEVGLPDVTAIPMAALQGDNVVHRSPAMPWYDGPALLEHLEQVSVERDHGRLVRPASRCSTSSGRCPTSGPTTAATPAPSPAARCGSATRWSCSLRGGTPRWPGSTPPTASWTARWPGRP